MPYIFFVVNLFSIAAGILAIFVLLVGKTNVKTKSLMAGLVFFAMVAPSLTSVMQRAIYQSIGWQASRSFEYVFQTLYLVMPIAAAGFAIGVAVVLNGAAKANGTGETQASLATRGPR